MQNALTEQFKLPQSVAQSNIMKYLSTWRNYEFDAHYCYHHTDYCQWYAQGILLASCSSLPKYAKCRTYVATTPFWVYTGFCNGRGQKVVHLWPFLFLWHHQGCTLGHPGSSLLSTDNCISMGLAAELEKQCLAIYICCCPMIQSHWCNTYFVLQIKDISRDGITQRHLASDFVKRSCCA